MTNAKRIGYRIDLCTPNDKSMIGTGTRNRTARLISTSLAIVVLLTAPTAFLAYWGWFLGNGIIGAITGLIGFGIGGEIVARLAPNRMFIYNPEWTGYVTQDSFAGTMVPYGPGFHLSHWWEVRNKRGNWSLKVITRDLDVGIATSTAKVTIHGKYEYAINLALIQRAIGIDDTTIESGITAFVDSFLTSQCAGKSADDIRKGIDQLNADLATEFMKAEIDDPGTPEDERNLSKLGDKYGFITVSVVIDNIELPAAVQKTRDAKDEAVQLFEVVANMYGIELSELKRRVAAKEISTEEYNKMLNRAMAASENATTMNVNVIEADIPALVGELAKKFAKGGTS